MQVAVRESKELLAQVNKGRDEAMRAFGRLQTVVHAMGGHNDFHDVPSGAAFQIRMPRGFPPLPDDNELCPTIH